MRRTIPTRHKGQSTIEYILLFTAVLTVVIFLLVSENAPYQAKLNATYSTALDGASRTTQQLFCVINDSVP